MTKKDYILIAQALKESEPTEHENEYGTAISAWVNAVNKLANTLQTENVKFDRARFISACGLIK